MQCRHVARQHHADFIGEDFLALIIHDPAACPPSPSKPSATSARLTSTASPHRSAAFSCLRYWDCSAEGVIEIAVERHHLAADGLQNRGAKAPAVPLPQAATTLSFRLSFGRWSGRQCSAPENSRRIRSCRRLEIEFRAQHDFLEAFHLDWPEGERPIGAHLHAGPAIVVV